MASETTKKIVKQVRPILSLDHTEARKRVLSLYKAWYRQIPFITKYYDIEYGEEACRRKLREEFTKYDKIKDVRILDMLIIRGQMDLKEIVEIWTTRRGVARYFKDKHDKQSDCFLDKFLTNKD